MKAIVDSCVAPLWGRRQWLLGLLGVMFGTGCVAFKRQVPAGLARGMQTILVVPLEAPPLKLPSSFEMAATGGTIHAAPPSVLLLVIEGILVLVKFSRTHKARPQIAADLDQWRAAETWQPSVLLADALRQKLAATGNWRIKNHAGVCDPGYEKRNLSWHMENWFGPIRRWYGRDGLIVPANQVRQQNADVVLELAISQELYGENLMLQVFLKVVDARTGVVVGRSRAASYTLIGPLDQAFKNRGEILRAAFQRLGNELLDQSLTTLGMVAKSPAP